MGGKRKMKKIIALFLSLVMVFAIVACTGSAASSQGGYKIAMITDYGDITDQSFNQTTYEACEAFAKDNNVEFTYKKPGDNNTEARVAMVDAAVADGYNVIVMPGYAFAGTIVEAAPKYPDVKFIALDVGVGDLLEAGVTAKGEAYDYNPDNWVLSDYVDLSNVYCAIYQEELCGYSLHGHLVCSGHRSRVCLRRRHLLLCCGSCCEGERQGHRR